MKKRDAETKLGVEDAVAEARRKVEQLRQSLDDSMSGRVVSLERVRELRFRLTMAGHEEFLAESWAEYRQLVRSVFLLNARILLDWVQRRCEAEGVSLVTPPGSAIDEEALARVADGLRTSSMFKRVDAVTRRLYCESHGEPFVSVRAHTRAGIPVQGYERYTGCPHYDSLPVDEFPPAVGRVIRLLQSLRA